MTNILLNGILLPLMATWFIPSAIKKHGYMSLDLATKLILVFAVSIVAYVESKGWHAIPVALFNCLLIYCAALAYLHLTQKKQDPDSS